MYRVIDTYRTVLTRGFRTSKAAGIMAPIKVGDSLPNVDLFDGTPENKVNAAEAFTKGTHVIFGIPGAFTPTCQNIWLEWFKIPMIQKIKLLVTNKFSFFAQGFPKLSAACDHPKDEFNAVFKTDDSLKQEEHVPSFIQDYDKLNAKGVDTINCVSVNDPFVMEAFGKFLGADKKVRCLADTCGAFSKAIDLTLDATEILGNVRSQRYAMVIKEGKVTALNIDENPKEATCSKASGVLNVL